MKRSAPASAGVVLLAFLAGFLTHVFYQRWNPASEIQQSMPNAEISAAANDGASTIHRVSFVPFAAVAEDTLADLPLVRGARGGKNSWLDGPTSAHPGPSVSCRSFGQEQHLLS